MYDPLLKLSSSGVVNITYEYIMLQFQISWLCLIRIGLLSTHAQPHSSNGPRSLLMEQCAECVRREWVDMASESRSGPVSPVWSNLSNNLVTSSLQIEEHPERSRKILPGESLQLLSNSSSTFILQYFPKELMSVIQKIADICSWYVSSCDVFRDDTDISKHNYAIFVVSWLSEETYRPR